MHFYKICSQDGSPLNEIISGLKSQNEETIDPILYSKSLVFNSTNDVEKFKVTNKLWPFY